MRKVKGMAQNPYNKERRLNLACAVRYYRRKKGYTQVRLAELAGVSRQHIVSVESTKMSRGISLELVFNIARALEVEPYMLFKFRLET